MGLPSRIIYSQAFSFSCTFPDVFCSTPLFPSQVINSPPWSHRRVGWFLFLDHIFNENEMLWQKSVKNIHTSFCQLLKAVTKLHFAITCTEGNFFFFVWRWSWSQSRCWQDRYVAEWWDEAVRWEVNVKNDWCRADASGVLVLFYNLLNGKRLWLILLILA